MGFIDYSRIGAPSYGKQITQLGDDIFEAMRARAADKQKAAAQAEQERHDKELEAYNRSLAWTAYNREQNQEKREQRRFENEQNDRSLKGVKEAYKALGDDDGSFDAIIAGNGFKDEQSNGYAKPEQPKAPTPVGERPEPTFIGPVQTLEDAMATARRDAPKEPPPFDGEVTPENPEPAMGEERARLAADKVREQQASIADYQSKLAGYRSDVDKFNQDQAKFVADEAAYPKTLRNYEEHTVHTLTLPNGQKVQMSVADARYASRSKAASDMRDAILPQLNAEMAHAQALHDEMGIARVQRKINDFNEHIQAVMGGMEKPDQAYKAFQAGISAKDVQDAAMARTKMTGEYSLERQRIANQKPSASVNLGGERLDFDKTKDYETRLRTDANGWKGTEVAKDLGEQIRSADNLTAKLASGEQGTVKNGLLELYRLAQHDNRMSDKDAVFANQVDQSVLSRIQNWVNMGAEGLPGDMNVQAAITTANRLRSFMHRKRDSLEKDWKEKFVHSGGYDAVDADILGSQIVPGYKRDTGADARPARAAGGGKGGGSRGMSASGSAVPTDDNGDPDLKALRDILVGK